MDSTDSASSALVSEASVFQKLDQASKKPGSTDAPNASATAVHFLNTRCSGEDRDLCVWCSCIFFSILCWPQCPPQVLDIHCCAACLIWPQTWKGKQIIEVILFSRREFFLLLFKRICMVSGTGSEIQTVDLLWCRFVRQVVLCPRKSWNVPTLKPKTFLEVISHNTDTKTQTSGKRIFQDLHCSLGICKMHHLWLSLFCGWVFSRLFSLYCCCLVASSIDIVGCFLTLQYKNIWGKKNPKKYLGEFPTVSNRSPPKLWATRHPYQKWFSMEYPQYPANYARWAFRFPVEWLRRASTPLV